MRARTVLISGAGITGPTFAYWLLQAGFTPTIVERAPALRTSGYMIDFWGVGYNISERMGLLPALLRDGYRLTEVRLVNEAGERVSGFDAQVFQSATAGRFISLPRGELARHCFELTAREVETLFGETISALEPTEDNVRVSFRRGQARSFDLVIGADGLHSNVRRLTFGPHDQCEKYLGYYTAAFSAPAYPHRDESAYLSYTTPGQQIAPYALRDGSSAFFFIFAQPEPLAMAHDDLEAQKQLLRERFAGTGWESDEIWPDWTKPMICTSTKWLKAGCPIGRADVWRWWAMRRTAHPSSRVRVLDWPWPAPICWRTSWPRQRGIIGSRSRRMSGPSAHLLKTSSTARSASAAGLHRAQLAASKFATSSRGCSIFPGWASTWFRAVWAIAHRQLSS